ESKLIRQLIQYGNELLVGRGGLVDQHVLAWLAPRREHLWTQDRRHEGGALLAHRWEEEARDQVVVRTGDLALDRQLGHSIRLRLLPRHAGVMLAAVDHLHIIDANNRQEMVQRVQRSP